MQKLKTLSSLCSCAVRFESYLVKNHEDRFSRDKVKKKKKKNLTNKHPGPLTYHFPYRLSSFLPWEKSYWTRISENFCIGNYLHFMGPFWRLVPVMTLVMLRHAGMQMASRWKFNIVKSGEKFCYKDSPAEFWFLRLWWTKFIRKNGK